MNATDYTYNGLRVGGWYGNFGSIMSEDTYEWSGVPGATDCWTLILSLIIQNKS